MKRGVSEIYDEKCKHCGYVQKHGEMNLIEEGMPISGTYYVCPECKKDWEYEKINVKQDIALLVTPLEEDFIKSFWIKEDDLVQKWVERTDLNVDFEPHDEISGTLILDMCKDTVLNPEWFKDNEIVGVRHQEHGLYIDVRGIRVETDEYC